MKTMVEEARALLLVALKKKNADGDGAAAEQGVEEGVDEVARRGFGNGSRKLSRGAAILLERTVRWCEEFMVTMGYETPRGGGWATAVTKFEGEEEGEDEEGEEDEKEVEEKGEKENGEKENGEEEEEEEKGGVVEE